MLTGDTLFVGDVGRPDLRAALGWSASQLGDLCSDPLHNKLLPLPDATLIYPAHGAGSLCGKAISRETVSTIGEQRRSNYAVQPMSKSAFVDLVTADQPDAPAYFTYDAVLNSQERPTLTDALTRELKPLSLDAVTALAARGAQLLDSAIRSNSPPRTCAAVSTSRWSVSTRPGRKPSSRAISRSSSLPIRAASPSLRSAWAASASTMSPAISKADFAASTAGPSSSSRPERLSPEVAAERMAGANPPPVIDVRQPPERACSVWTAACTFRSGG